MFSEWFTIYDDIQANWRNQSNKDINKICPDRIIINILYIFTNSFSTYRI